MSIFCNLHHSSPTPCIILQHDVFLTVRGCWTLHKSQCHGTLCQPSVITHSIYSPVTNTYVHKSVSSHISRCTPCVYVLACILRMFLCIGGYNSVRHGTASDIGTAVLLRMYPKLEQTTSELVHCLLSSKPCLLETQMIQVQDLRFTTQSY
jgi:hypothetical protein